MTVTLTWRGGRELEGQLNAKYEGIIYRVLEKEVIQEGELKELERVMPVLYCYYG